MLTGLFWFATIFGGGVTLIDLLGLIGGGADETGDGAAGEDADGAAEAVHHGAAEAVHHGAAEAVHHGAAEAVHHGDVSGAPVLSFLRGVRSAVYFCLGFGPFGLAAGAFGAGAAGRLAWSLAGGVALAVLARLFFRFQRTRLDSTLQDEELLLEPAIVIVPIASGGMGKVRVHYGQSVAERYARAERAEQRFAVDDRVIISQVTDQCVFVRKEEPC